MRLKYVYISDYKNLKNFELNFESDSFLDVFVGKNGSGKSNLFEAIIKIFHHLYEDTEETANPNFNYKLIYDIDRKSINISWEKNKKEEYELKIDGKDRKKMGETPLPDNLIIYYSGHNEAVTELIENYKIDFKSKIKKADFEESRKLIGVGAENKRLLLSVLLLLPPNNPAKNYVCNRLGIVKEAKEIRLTLKRPDYATKKDVYNVDRFDESTAYWKAEGNTKAFLDLLEECLSIDGSSPARAEGLLPVDDKYINYYDIAKIREKFSDYSAQDFFRQLDNLETIGMLEDINLLYNDANGIPDEIIPHFSDGQFQSVYIYSIAEIFKDRNCITLLDEPDAFLHPEWQFDFLKQVFDISKTATKNNHILMCSHSASTLCNVEEKNINLFTIKNSDVVCERKTKKEIINELSNSIIQYSEDESKLLINNVIRTSIKPILFVEGITDVDILNTAYKKLYPDEDMPILVQDAFDIGFIKILMSRDELFVNYPDKWFFSLLDFYKAYEDWSDLGGN
ncbi:MAG: AAA family ATPase, partial [Alphaproteobacteria bacterium]